MIYTMTMNPALDYVVDLPSFKLGQVNRTEDEHIFYGGKGINVSVVLKELGFESTCLGFIAGFTGDELQDAVLQGIRSRVMPMRPLLARNCLIRFKRSLRNDLSGCRRSGQNPSR